MEEKNTNLEDVSSKVDDSSNNEEQAPDRFGGGGGGCRCDACVSAAGGDRFDNLSEGKRLPTATFSYDDVTLGINIDDFLLNVDRGAFSDEVLEEVAGRILRNALDPSKDPTFAAQVGFKTLQGDYLGPFHFVLLDQCDQHFTKLILRMVLSRQSNKFCSELSLESWRPFMIFLREMYSELRVHRTVLKTLNQPHCGATSAIVTILGFLVWSCKFSQKNKNVRRIIGEDVLMGIFESLGDEFCLRLPKELDALLEVVTIATDQQTEALSNSVCICDIQNHLMRGMKIRCD